MPARVLPCRHESLMTARLILFLRLSIGHIHFTQLLPIRSLICFLPFTLCFDVLLCGSNCFARSFRSCYIIRFHCLYILLQRYSFQWWSLMSSLQAACVVVRSFLDHSVFLQYVESDPFNENAIPGKKLILPTWRISSIALDRSNTRLLLPNSASKNCACN